MFYFISVLIFLVCLLLILIVLVQNSKGGGLAANFSSSNQVMGVRKTNDFLEKATWTLAAALLFLCVVAAGFVHTGNSEAGNESLIQKHIEEAPDPVNMPGNLPVAPTQE
jgi:preprotein translocase subunit SecG